jgi:hypothetical protein
MLELCGSFHSVERWTYLTTTGPASSSGGGSRSLIVIVLMLHKFDLRPEIMLHKFELRPEMKNTFQKTMAAKDPSIRTVTLTWKKKVVEKRDTTYYDHLQHGNQKHQGNVTLFCHGPSGRDPSSPS